MRDAMYFFWDSVPGRVLAAVLTGLTLGGIVLALGSLQNGLIWDHLTPDGANDWGVLALACGAAVYGVYLSATGRIGD